MSKPTRDEYIESIVSALNEYFAIHGKLFADVCAKYLVEIKLAEQNGLRAIIEDGRNE